MNKKLRKLILPVSLLAASQAYALGLGSLQVESTLDEALRGQIPIILGNGEVLENIEVSLASASDYEKVGLDRAYVPSNISVKIVENSGGKYIELSSTGVVSEPIVSLLLVVDWANGHLLREYTLLLDPPLFSNNQGQGEFSDPVQTQQYQVPKQVDQGGDSTNLITNDSFPASSSYNPSSSSSRVEVSAGDTLWKIASQISNGNTPQQVMVAIFNNNPSAFQNNDMNFLKKGVVLEIPDANQIAAISNSSAIAEVRSQTQSWSRLQTEDNNVSSVSSDSTADYGIELVPPSDSDSTDLSTGSGSNTANNLALVAELSQAKEELVNSNLENSDLAGRVKELERIIEDQGLAISLKDTNLSQLQDQLGDASEVVDEVIDENVEEVSDLVDEVKDDVWDTTEPAVTAIDDNVDELIDETSEGVTELVNEVTDSTDETVSDSDNEISDESISETSVDDNTTIDVDPVETTEVIQEQVVRPPVKKQSFMDKVLAYKKEGLIGLGALLLGLITFLFFKNKGKENEVSDSESFLDSISNDNLSEDVKDIKDETLGEAVDKLETLTDETEEIIENVDPEPDVILMDEDELDDVELDLDKIEIGEEDLDDVELDLDKINIGEDDLNLDEVVENTAEELADELDLDLDELDLETDDLDFDLDEEDTTEETLDDELSIDLDLDADTEENFEDELEDLSFDTDEDTIVNASDEVEDLEFELDDSLELDLDEGDLSLAVEDNSEVIETITEDVDIGLDLDDIIVDDAIDTKLDLAKAYYEMGDIDGANQMVDEIMEEGNDEQKSKAKNLKNEIDS